MSDPEDKAMSVVVLGSINMDLVVRTPRLPVPGETLTAHRFFTAPGGKGANQAVACARLGAATRMVGRVGKDIFGEQLIGGLRDAGVDISAVTADPDQSSGVAVIAVDDRAENSILIVPGANGAVGVEELAGLNSALDSARLLLLQLEVPIEAVLGAAQAARERGVTVTLDPAPARPLPLELFRLVDVLTPNETEAEALVGFPVRDQAAAESAARVLLEHGAKRVIVKMGSKGAYWADGTAAGFVPAFKVVAVDTVAAGDAFNGGLAVALTEGLPFAEAVRWGAAAGAVSVTRAGAQPSMPNRDSLMEMLG